MAERAKDAAEEEVVGECDLWDHILTDLLPFLEITDRESVRRCVKV